MTITIDEPLAARIRTAAAARGQEPEAFATAALNRVVEDTTIKPVAEMTFKPFEKFVGEQREKHGLSADWGTKPVVLTEEDWAKIDVACADLYPEAKSDV